MGKRYVQLSLEERCTIALLCKAGQSVRQIAASVDRAASTISRELRRNTQSCKNGYHPRFADEQNWARRWRGSKLERNPDLQKYVVNRLVMGWSPQQIAGRITLEEHSTKISHESIYRFIYAQYARTKDKNWRMLLPRAKFKRGWRGRRGGSSLQHIRHRVPISQRPEAANTRKEFGHWETDLMMFSNKKHNLLVIQERQSRYVKLSLNDNKEAQNVADCLIKWLKPLPKDARKSMTQDNGTEYAKHYQLHEIEMHTYFCDVRSPWQKGAVENTNGRLRRYLPLKTDPNIISAKDIEILEKMMNNTPRKCLGYKTPEEVFNKALHFKCESTFRPAPE